MSNYNTGARIVHLLKRKLQRYNINGLQKGMQCVSDYSPYTSFMYPSFIGTVVLL